MNSNYNSFSEFIASEEYQNYQINLEEAIVQFKQDSRDFFNSLPYEQQLMVFSHVVSSICKNEFEDKGTYRHLLYDIFNFNTDSYAIGMDCGLLELHNSIYSYEELIESIKQIINHLKIDYSTNLVYELFSIIKYGKINTKNPYQLNLDF